MFKYLYWPAAAVLMALGQGLLMPAIRLTPPGPEAKRQSLALHVVLTAVYFLPLLLAPSTWLESVLSRVLLFDPVLNLGAGANPFAVGATAITDRTLRWLAARLSWPPERLRLVVWVLSVGAACLFFLINKN